jgi:hypothetical protein
LEGLDAFHCLLRKNKHGRYCWDANSLPGYRIQSNIEHNVKEVEEDLNELLARITNVPFLPNLPKWRAFSFVKGGKSILILKISHVITDGPGMSFVFARMMDGDRVGAVMKEIKIPRPSTPKRHTIEVFMSWLWTSICFIYVMLKGHVFFLKPKKDFIFPEEDGLTPRKVVLHSKQFKLSDVGSLVQCYSTHSFYRSREPEKESTRIAH